MGQGRACAVVALEDATCWDLSQRRLSYTPDGAAAISSSYADAIFGAAISNSKAVAKVRDVCAAGLSPELCLRDQLTGCRRFMVMQLLCPRPSQTASWEMR